MPTLVYHTGFEHGQSLSATGLGLCDTVVRGTGSTLDPVNTRSRSGSWSLRMTSNGSSTGCWYQKRTLGTGGVIVVRFGIFVHARGAGTISICALGPSAFLSDYGNIYLSSAGVLSWDAFPGATIRSGPTLALDTWYMIEAKHSSAGTTYTMDVKVDRADAGLQATSTGRTADAGARGFALQLFSATAANTNGADIYFDDVAVSMTSGDWPLRDGSGACVKTTPGAAAEHQSITLSEWQTTPDFSSFTNFASTTETVSAGLIDELNSTDGIRVTATGAPAGNARWPLADPVPDPGTVPNGVRAVFSAREASSGTNNFILRVLLGASTTDIFNANPGWTTTWNWVGGQVAKPGGGSWTAQDIRDLKLEMDSTDAAPAIWVGGVCIEVDYPIPISITITPATETDAAQTLVVTKPIKKTLTPATETDTAVALVVALNEPISITLTPATETDAAQALTVKKSRTLVAATETDAAQALVVKKSETLTAATETDAAQALRVAKPRTLTAATETDAAQTLQVRKSRALTTATETDAAQPLAVKKQATIPAATETDAAQTLVALKPIHVTVTAATETDASQPVRVTKSLKLTTATETDGAQTLALLKPIHVTLTSAVETDAAQALVVRKQVGLTSATETDTAVALRAARPAAITSAATVDVAQTLTLTKPIYKMLVSATETDAAQALALAKRVSIAAAVEVDVAQPLTVTKPIAFSIEPAYETDTAQVLPFGQPIPQLIVIVPATESDAAQHLVVVKPIYKTITPATDQSSAQPLVAAKRTSIAAATDISSAQTLRVAYTMRLVPATETDTAQTLTVHTGPGTVLEPATTTDVAQALTFSKSLTLDAAVEVDNSMPLVFIKRLSYQPVIEGFLLSSTADASMIASSGAGALTGAAGVDSPETGAGDAAGTLLSGGI